MGAVFCPKKDRDVHILADSLSSIYLIMRMVRSPDTMTECKQRHLLLYILESITGGSQQGWHTTNGKVKSHTGVRGNEEADRCAAEAAEGDPCHHYTELCNESTGYLHSWQQEPGLEPGTSRPLNDLTHDVRAHVMSVVGGGTLPHTTYTNSRSQVNDVSHKAASNHMWNAGVLFSTIRNIFKIRYGLQYTAQTARKWKKPSMGGMLPPKSTDNGGCPRLWTARQHRTCAWGMPG